MGTSRCLRSGCVDLLLGLRPCVSERSRVLVVTYVAPPLAKCSGRFPPRSPHLDLHAPMRALLPSGQGAGYSSCSEPDPLPTARDDPGVGDAAA